MATTLTQLTACPPWCTLEPGHPWDSIHDDGRQSRGHGGPQFGRFLFAGSLEMETGEVTMDVEIHTEDKQVNDLSVADLLDLAAHTVAAAEWLEANR
ncbi:hypothetical protein [Nocardioides lijunqiniae]|uniref:hypothetical protein n=1 Tax=Nocardioides lijunqiniae TaxID=2760832 RepID=UPI001878540C|nr:hypothetical protein [Nocardioides lijunqiniae]